MKKLLCLIMCLLLCLRCTTAPAFASEAVAEAEYTLYTVGDFLYEAPSAWEFTQESDQNNHVYAIEGAGLQNMLTATVFPIAVPADDVTETLHYNAVGTSGFRDGSLEWLTIDGYTAVTYVATQTFYGRDVAAPHLLCVTEDAVLIVYYVSPFASEEETLAAFRQIISTIRTEDPAKAVSVQELQNLSLKELSSLLQQIPLAAQNSEKWQEVTVPINLYEIGTDIPAGHWTIRAVESGYVYLEYGDVLKKSGKEIDYLESDVYISDFIYSPSRRSYKPNSDIVQYDISVEDGYYLSIDSGNAVFTPYIGKLSPQFESSTLQDGSSARVTPEEDLSALSLNELAALHQQIIFAMWETGEWTEVTVPIGIYEIGADIPAGHWKIEAADGTLIFLTYGDVLDKSGRNIDLWDSEIYAYEVVHSPTASSYDADSDITEYDLKLEDGCYLMIENGYAVLSPYTGKTPLGFE